MFAPGVPLAKVLVILDAGRRRGVDVSAWTERLKLSDARTEASAEHRVPAGDVAALWAELLRGSRDPSLPLDVAQRLRIDAYDVFGFALLTSPDVRTALRRACRYFSLTGNPGRLALLETADEALVEHDRPAQGPVALGVRAAIECALAQVLHMVRQTLQRELRPLRVDFAHAAPDDVDAHRAFFGTAPTFSAKRNALVFERALLAEPLPPVHGALAAFFERHVERLHQSFASVQEPDLVARTRAALADETLDAPPTLPVVATRLGMSARTLRRRLGEEGPGFKTLRDEVLRARATDLLSRPSPSLVEVSLMLGFSDQTAFQRAFRRWTGTTPQAWRRDALRRR